MTVLDLKNAIYEYARSNNYFVDGTEVFIGEYDGYTLYNIGEIKTAYIGDKEITILVPSKIDFGKAERESEAIVKEKARLMLYEQGVLKHTEPKSDIKSKSLVELFGIPDVSIGGSDQHDCEKSNQNPSDITNG